MPTAIGRRQFLVYLGAGAAGLAAGCAGAGRGGLGPLARLGAAGRMPFAGFAPRPVSMKDDLDLPDGFTYRLVRVWGDPVTESREIGLERFGYNADYTGLLPLPGGDANREGLLFVNHEYVNLPHDGQVGVYAQTFETLTGKRMSPDEIKFDLGASVLHVRKNGAGLWTFVEGSRYNRRITASPAFKPVLLAADGPGAAVLAATNADRLGAEIHGTHSNCSGATTPWGTFLSCEENVQFWTPEAVDTTGRGTVGGMFEQLGSKYGWVVEVDPYDPASVPVKHTALGRFRHENVALRAEASRVVAAYMGDDRTGGHVYKFVSATRYQPGTANRPANMKLLSEGRLFAAKLNTDGSGEWLPLEPEQRLAPNAGQPMPTFLETARTLTDVYETPGAILIDAFRACNAVGATPCGRPEDLEVHDDGSVYIAFTENGPRGSRLFTNRFGEIWRLVEEGNDPTAMRFRWERFSAGGGAPEEGGYSSPDNLIFDRAGNLWVVTDIATRAHNRADDPRGVYGNNSLLVIPTSGPDAGRPRRFASGPSECELTGPTFTPDETALFISIQHPGERGGVRTAESRGAGLRNGAVAGSNWPTPGKLGAPPRPGVVVISRA
jgi:secreted PhoX family phosphatase